MAAVLPIAFATVRRCSAKSNRPTRTEKGDAEAQCPLRRVNQDALASRFAASYRWNRGYGPGTEKVLKRLRRGQPWTTANKSVYPQGSFGNGAAMRAPVLAMYFTADEATLLKSAAEPAVVTHGHPTGVDGCCLIALATRLVLNDAGSSELISKLIACSQTPEITHRLAIYIALRHRDDSFASMMQFTIDCGSDVDTIGAMAGALWGAASGDKNLPTVAIEDREQIVQLATYLFEQVS